MNNNDSIEFIEWQAAFNNHGQGGIEREIRSLRTIVRCLLSVLTEEQINQVSAEVEEESKL